jgi:2-hydroxy-3-keto-5-methylthiopentenyl-1-phosphate phosphatase
MSDSIQHVFVTDFDGTMTKNDFYNLVVSNLLSDETPDYWVEYREGQITHFEALRRYFAAIRADEATVLKLVDAMELDPQVNSAVAELRRSHWNVVIASAGCRWYIERLLSAAGVQIELHANPGRFETGKGLLMEMPNASPFLSSTLGIDKSAVVRHYLSTATQVAFAGDGFPDFEAARLVPSNMRFARGDLATVLTQSDLEFQPYDTWSDIARVLIAERRIAT